MTPQLKRIKYPLSIPLLWELSYILDVFNVSEEGREIEASTEELEAFDESVKREGSIFAHDVHALAQGRIDTLMGFHFKRPKEITEGTNLLGHRIGFR